MCDIVRQKQQIRKEYLNLRNKISAEELKDKSSVICQKFIDELLPQIKFNNKTIFALYLACQNEVDNSLIKRNFIEKNINFSYPRLLNKKEMEFVKYQKNSKFINSKIFKNISEIEFGEIVTPEILIIPLISFDSSKMRLGFGGGFYDRYLNALNLQNKKALKIGLAYDFQEFKGNISYDKFDQKLDFIVTNNKIFC